MSNDKVIEFKFERKSNYWSIDGLKEHYQVIFQNYVKQVLNKNEEVKLVFEDLNFAVYDYNYHTMTVGKERNILKHILPHGNNLKVSLLFSDNNHIFDFYIYNQNNCCGAISTSKTTVSYRDKKLGHILQHMKEDIAIISRMSLMTCTDVYHSNYRFETEEAMNDLKPYLPNTKVLLNSGWNISKLFWNRNSANVVALYTKKVKYLEKNTIIKMKIKEEDKLVKIENVSIGADPELFLKSKETGEFVPSYSFIKGDKYTPTPISDKGHNIQCDNVMVEYGIPPSKTVEEFVENNLFVQDYLKTKIADPNNLELVIFPFANFQSNELKDERAKAFGCDPDFNVWANGKPNEVGRPEKTARCSGGHIHVGYDNHNRVTSNYIVKALDLFLSVPLVLMEPNNRRKEMYGKAGSFRPQPWGVEYRSTSNYIFSSPELMTWAFNQVKKAIDFVNDEDSRQMLDVKSSNIIYAINSKDKAYAKDLITRFDLVVLEEVVAK